MKFKNIFKSKTTQILAATLATERNSACTNLDEEVRDEVFGGQHRRCGISGSRCLLTHLGDAGCLPTTAACSPCEEYSSDIAAA